MPNAPGAARSRACPNRAARGRKPPHSGRRSPGAVVVGRRSRTPRASKPEPARPPRWEDSGRWGSPHLVGLSTATILINRQAITDTTARGRRTRATASAPGNAFAGPAFGLIAVGVFGLVIPAVVVVLGVVFLAMPLGVQAYAPADGFAWSSSPLATVGVLGALFGAVPAVGPAEAQLLLSACSLLVSIVILWGGISMKKLRSYALAMSASILAMIPCFSPCCLVGIPIGIWALVVLSDPSVRAAFS